MSNSDSDNNDIFSDSDEELDKIVTPKIAKKSSKSKKSLYAPENNKITTEGIEEQFLKSINLEDVQDIIQCHCCSKYYNKSLIVNDEGFGEQMCKHCLCWLSYSVDTRLEFDNKCVSLHGFCIAEYILTCHEAHNSETCARMTDNGGCLLCDYNLNLDIPNILNSEMLPKVLLKSESNKKDSEKKVKKIMIVDNDIAIHGAEEYFKKTKLII